jgi:hypothetical protein
MSFGKADVSVLFHAPERHELKGLNQDRSRVPITMIMPHPAPS